jgi:hypothetical protein
MPQVRNSFDADRKRDYFSPYASFNHGERRRQEVLAPIRRDFAKKNFGVAEVQLAPAVPIRKSQPKPRVDEDHRREASIRAR